MSEKLFQDIFGIEFGKVKQFFSDLSKADMKNVVPQGRVINVYLVIRANNELLIRHEGEEDISLATIQDDKYPIILYEKFQSVYRRKELELLRHDYNLHKEEINKIRGNNDEWFCALRPSASVKDEKIGGQCGECPDCITFGFAVRKEGRYNVKSRIEGDLFIATLPEKKSVVIRTFNAVDDVTKTTIIGGGEEKGRTGALFRLSLVREGTIFVGKIAMKDVGLNDFLLKIAVLTTVTKIGGNTTDFGNIKVFIPAIMFSTHEVSSGYDLFLQVKGKEDVDTVISSINSYLDKVKKGVLVTSNDFTDSIKNVLFNSDGTIKHEIIKNAWNEAKIFKDSIELAISKK